MKELKYTYALDKNGLCVEIHNARSGVKYYCPHCDAEMIVKDGQIKTKHYSHKTRPISCNYETYLHSLAKLKIEEWFNSDKAFNISIKIKDECENSRRCVWNHDESIASNYCQSDSSRVFDLKKFYGEIAKEKYYKGFRSDLLVYSKDNDNDPIFIEIFVSHSCEKEKIESGIRIIELRLSTESDLYNIIRSGTINENAYASFYNFKRKSGTVITEGVQLNKFVLLESMHGFCPDNRSNCKIYTQRHPTSIFEITFDYLANRGSYINPYIIGWAMAHKYCENVRSCFLCKYYTKNIYNNRYLCCLYKRLNTDKYCKSNTAIKCNAFRINEIVLNEVSKHLENISYNIWKKGMDSKGQCYFKKGCNSLREVAQ